jgi:hypothetical protein
MGIGRDLIESLGEVSRIGARTGQCKVFADTAIERSEAFTLHRCGFAPATVAQILQHSFEFGPLVLIQRLELQRRHHGWRLPSSHWATPRTRRVTTGPDSPALPLTGAASAASSSSRSTVSRGARAAKAMTAL